MKKHTKLLKDFLNRLGFTNVRVRNNYASQSDIVNEIIYYNPKGEGKLDEIIKSIYIEKNQDIKISMSTYAFFHELGHLLSIQELDDIDDELDVYHQQVTILNLMYENDDEQLMKTYRELKLEKLADKYAYEVYKKYEPLAIKLDKKLQELEKSR